MTTAYDEGDDSTLRTTLLLSILLPGLLAFLLMCRQMQSPSPPPKDDSWIFFRKVYKTLETVADRWTTDEAARKRRAHVLRELFETEEFYVQRLRYVIDRFIMPLRATGKGAHADAVWQGWEPITELHEDFLQKLRRALEKPNPPRERKRPQQHHNNDDNHSHYHFEEEQGQKQEQEQEQEQEQKQKQKKNKNGSKQKDRAAGL